MAVWGILYGQRAIRRERAFKDPLDQLAISDVDLLRHYRFPRLEILEITDELRPYLERTTERGHAIPAVTQVLAALRFYASGTFQNVIAETMGVHQCSVSRIIGDVTILLTFKEFREINMPETDAEKLQTMLDFANLQNFPRCIGAIDGTHIPIKPPSHEEFIYVNRKRFHSLNVQIICNARHEIIDFNARYPGSTHDSYIWSNSYTRSLFVNGEFGESLLIGDSGYTQEPFLMTPVNNPNTAAERRYNRSHRRSRVIVEQTFGILKSRFRCLHKSGGSLQYNPDKSAHIVVACLILHNMCIKRRIPNPGEDEINNVYQQQQQNAALPVAGLASLLECIYGKKKLNYKKIHNVYGKNNYLF
ncbi:unnamed protein product [Meganyctiphanes norvegica]|uniref:Putative nuclease HARBI1 n=1 Tax=Meganyctiphanes norvegica TaxID=48144 RepID=A0AAV2QR43_MEGNR